MTKLCLQSLQIGQVLEISQRYSPNYGQLSRCSLILDLRPTHNHLHLRRHGKPAFQTEILGQCLQQGVGMCHAKVAFCQFLHEVLNSCYYWRTIGQVSLLCQCSTLNKMLPEFWQNFSLWGTFKNNRNKSYVAYDWLFEYIFPFSTNQNSGFLCYHAKPIVPWTTLQTK